MDGTFTIRNKNFFFTYVHHCHYCDNCEKEWPTDISYFSKATCGTCGNDMRWLTNEQAVTEGVNLHPKDSGCPICEVTRMTKTKKKV